MRSGLVAIVLCTFNGSKYIEELMDSIIVQTYENWELWISDDGSKDNTISVVRQYAEHAPAEYVSSPDKTPHTALQQKSYCLWNRHQKPTAPSSHRSEQ